MKYLTLALILILPQWALAQSRFDYVCPASIHRTDPPVTTEVRVVNTTDTPAEIDCHFRNVRGEKTACYWTVLSSHETEIIRPNTCRKSGSASCIFKTGSIFLSSSQPVAAVAMIYVQDILIGIVTFDLVIDTGPGDSSLSKQSRAEAGSQSSSRPGSVPPLWY